MYYDYLAVNDRRRYRQVGYGALLGLLDRLDLLELLELGVGLLELLLRRHLDLGRLHSLIIVVVGTETLLRLEESVGRSVFGSVTIRDICLRGELHLPHHL